MPTTAGCRTIEVRDDDGTPFPLLLLYPARAAERPERLGPYVLDVARDAPVADGAVPLVAVSHGSGGSPLSHRLLAAHLARHGFVVALPTHPRNNRDDDSRAGTHTLLADRPPQLRRPIDAALADAALAPHLVADAVAVVGHSMGGYTALALAGARPAAFAHETPDGRPRAVHVAPDPRVRALVLLAPATPWFMAPGALDAVRVPILMLSAEHDPHTTAWHGEVVARGVPAGTPLERRTVPNAGHFAFIAPFPAAMASPAFAPSQDPPGFDRAAFHDALNDEVLAFLRRALGGPR